MKRILLLTGILILTAVIFASCGGDDDKGPAGSTNKAPGTVTLDSGPSGAPANGATGVSLTPTLRWNCTDPDGDALTFAVSFGTGTPLPVVSPNQSASSYSPASLEYSTTYSWSVKAKDPTGATSTSEMWSFTTLDPLAETVSTPSVPIGPASGFENQDYAYTATGSISSYSDAVEYRFDWGGQNYSDWGTAPVLNSWVEGTYEVKAQARCITHPSVVSDWSSAKTVTISAPPAEAVSSPAAPTGPATGYVDQDLAYEGSAAISNLGHDLEYSFDWGDGGSQSAWSPIAINNSWAEGTYEVRAQARCIAHPTVVSDWSIAKTVTITTFALETIGTPGLPSGKGTAEEGNSINFAVAEVTTTYGHNVEYRWDFSDGAPTSWSSVRSRSHVWATAGTYYARAQARCADHNEIISDWSVGKTVTITVAAAETVSAPNTPSGPATGTTGVNLVVTNEHGASSTYSHPLDYRFAFGDADTSVWFYNWTTIQHSYDPAGTYNVKMQARCRTHTAIESEWSEALSIVISDPPEALAYNTGLVYGDVTDGEIGESYEYSVAHSGTTNLGDPMEGQYSWGDGEKSDWVQAADRNQSHAWTAEGTYAVTYQGRCSVHNGFTFNTDTLWVTMVTEATETISKPLYNPNYNKTPDVGVPTNYYAFGGASSLGHDTESRIDWGDLTPMSDWTAGFTAISHTWTSEGTYGLKRQTRCIEHFDIVSEWSDPINISPRGPETVSTPDAPPGPATATMGTSPKYAGTGALSSWHYGSWIEYRFAFTHNSDTTAWKPRLDTLQAHYFPTMGEFEVTTQARCSFPGHGNPESEWSLPTSITITERITYKGIVYGPFEGPIDRAITFVQSTPATSGVGHAIEYHFDFGDADTSDWSSELTASHSYATAGRFFVKCQARCAEHTDAVSEWKTTNLHPVDITDGPETVSVPNINQQGQVTIGDSAVMKAYRSFSNHGDSLEYQLDYGDGNPLSDWIPTTQDRYDHFWDPEPEWTRYLYANVGTYAVKGRTRCAIHNEIISEWSSYLAEVKVIEAVSMPATPTGPATGTVGQNMTFETTGATSSEGHTLEYYYSYRTAAGSSAGSSGDYITSLSHTHVFMTAGDYYVYILTRCVEHNNAQNGWSEKFYFTITE